MTIVRRSCLLGRMFGVRSFCCAGVWVSGGFVLITRSPAPRGVGRVGVCVYLAGSEGASTRCIRKVIVQNYTKSNDPSHFRSLKNKFCQSSVFFVSVIHWPLFIIFTCRACLPHLQFLCFSGVCFLPLLIFIFIIFQLDALPAYLACLAAQPSHHHTALVYKSVPGLCAFVFSFLLFLLVWFTVNPPNCQVAIFTPKQIPPVGVLLCSVCFLSFCLYSFARFYKVFIYYVLCFCFILSFSYHCCIFFFISFTSSHFLSFHLSVI